MELDLEKDLQDLIGKDIIRRGWKFRHIPKGLAKKSKALRGISDYLGFAPKTVFFIEFKNPKVNITKSSIRPKQVEFKAMLDMFCIPNITSNDFDEIISFLDDIEGLE